MKDERGIDRTDFPLGLHGIRGEELGNEIKFSRLKSVIKTRACS